jgi:hypothetical protein
VRIPQGYKIYIIDGNFMLRKPFEMHFKDVRTSSACYFHTYNDREAQKSIPTIFRCQIFDSNVSQLIINARTLKNVLPLRGRYLGRGATNIAQKQNGRYVPSLL